MELHTDLEGKLPVKIIDMVDKLEYRNHPNKCTGFFHQVSIPNYLVSRIERKTVFMLNSTRIKNKMHIYMYIKSGNYRNIYAIM